MRIAIAGGTGTVGRHAVALARDAGNEVVALSPSRGVDVRSGERLGDALAEVDLVLDVTNAGTVDESSATEFFTAVAQNLQTAGAAAGVAHIVTLSIVGIDKTSFGYYRAKLAHEAAAHSGSVPATVMRATQLHEFAAQVIGMTREGTRASVFDVEVQPVAARTVARVLLEVGQGSPVERAPDLAGPQRERLVELARALAARRAPELEIRPDPGTMSGVPPGALLAGEGARLEGPSFQEWLDSEDAAALAI